MTRPGSVHAGSVHATCLVIGETGILIRGAAGSGKTALALRLVAEATRLGRFARIVADDRVVLDVSHGRLLARPHPRIAGRLERRGEGIVDQVHEPAARIGLVVDLGEEAPRMPPEAGMHVAFDGVAVDRLMLGARPGDLEPILDRAGLRP